MIDIRVPLAPGATRPTLRVRTHAARTPDHTPRQDPVSGPHLACASALSATRHTPQRTYRAHQPMHTSVVEGAVGGFDSRGGLQSEPQRLLSLVPFEYCAERRRRRTGVLRTVSSRYFNACLVAVAISALWARVAASPPCAAAPWHDCRLWPPQIHARLGTHTPPILPALLVLGEKFNPARKPS